MIVQVSRQQGRGPDRLMGDRTHTSFDDLGDPGVEGIAPVRGSARRGASANRCAGSSGLPPESWST